MGRGVKSFLAFSPFSPAADSYCSTCSFLVLIVDWHTPHTDTDLYSVTALSYPQAALQSLCDDQP